jgi:hypothetical protein
MKHILIIFAISLFISEASIAQEYKLSKSTGTLNINEVNHVTIEGTTGNEIIFTSRDNNRNDDERARGLRAVSSLGLDDNTGIGLSVLDKGSSVEVNQLKKIDGTDFVIKVPKGIKVSYSHSSPYGGEFEVKNFEGAVIVSTVHNSVIINNASGSIDVKTTHGDIDATFASVNSALTLNSMHGHVDVALPTSTKANLHLETNWGEILVDPDFKIEIPRSGDLVKYNDNVNGKINGGGIDVDLSSMHNNVYLRKK